ncbi:Hypothetical_protein [Hexamita inflata]|uniref:Hypothetical_protein n=1 Tax=Hexamita inflata TaxID=28002 RepID=A0AA86R3J3_9EUKA|nr:Hypothetical protein HINF_LOCUS53077 [Hexamita inflata]
MTCVDNEIQNSVAYNTINIIISVVQLSFVMFCFVQFKRSNEFSDRSTLICYSSFALGQFILMSLQIGDFFASQNSSLRNLLQVLEGSFGYVFNFSIPIVCACQTIADFISQFCFNTYSKRLSRNWNLVFLVSVGVSMANNAAKIITELLIIKDVNISTSQTVLEVLYFVNVILLFIFCFAAFAFSIVFFVVYKQFVYQQLENVQTPAMTDYNFKQMKHLAVSVSAAGGILMVNMVIQMFMSQENEQCQWGPTIVNWILSVMFTLFLITMYAPLCKKQGNKMQEEIQGLLQE